MPEKIHRVGETVPFADARNVYVARTYAYVSAGKDGIGIVDVEQPEHPKMAMSFNAGGALNDTTDLKIGMVSSSQFAFRGGWQERHADRAVVLAGDAEEFLWVLVRSRFRS